MRGGICAYSKYGQLIETLTDDAMRVDEKPEGGYLKLELPDEVSEGTNLLMKSLVLGLQAIEKAYGSQFLTVTFAGESQENMD